MIHCYYYSLLFWLVKISKFKRGFCDIAGHWDVLSLLLGIFSYQKLLSSSQVNLGQKSINAVEVLRPMNRVYYKSSCFNSLLEDFPPTKHSPFPAQGRIERVLSTAWAFLHHERKKLKPPTHSFTKTQRVTFLSSQGNHGMGKKLNRKHNRDWIYF